MREGLAVKVKNWQGIAKVVIESRSLTALEH